MSRVERLVNLTAYLLDSPRPRTAEDIREKITGYDQEHLDSFRRMFERDKESLREMEIPLEVIKIETDDGFMDGYSISEERYRMQDPELAADEQAALMIALEMVRVAGVNAEKGNRQLSRMKLGIDSLSEEIEVPPMASVDLGDETVLTFFDAVTERREVHFRYRRPDGLESKRTLQPMSLANVAGQWYVGGRDLERGADRVYRVDRVLGEVELGEPGAFEVETRPDIRSQLSGGPWTFGAGEVEVRVRFDADVEWRARSLFRSAAEFEKSGGSVVMTMNAAEPANLIESILSFGADAEVLAPESLRSDLIEHLRATLR